HPTCFSTVSGARPNATAHSILSNNITSNNTAISIPVIGHLASVSCPTSWIALETSACLSRRLPMSNCSVGVPLPRHPCFQVAASAPRHDSGAQKPPHSANLHLETKLLGNFSGRSLSLP